VIERDVSFDGGQQADDLLFADLHPPADSHAGADRALARCDQIGAA
jgi:hypothetical protein